MPPELHGLAGGGKTEELRQRLNDDSVRIYIDGYDRLGRTPLMCAVQSNQAGIEIVRLLIDNGASIQQASTGVEDSRSVLSLAVAAGDPGKVAVLLDHGADIRYRRKHGYDVLIDALNGRDVARDTRLLELLRLLISHGVDLNTVTDYNESALRVLSRIGRFDAVQRLIEAGADESLLQWTPLIRAVALGNLHDVEREIETGRSIEDRDWWNRTAWLVSVQTGEIDKAHLLKEHGAAENARGRCGKTALLFAIENHRTPMLEWLLQIGARIEESDDFGTTPLMCAAEYENPEAVQVLLRAGADVDHGKHHEQTALSFASTREVATMLLNSGADPAKLSFEGRRALIGLDPTPDEVELTVTSDEFRSGRMRRFGTQNPEEINDPFWHCMIRAGVAAFQAKQFYKTADGSDDSAVWCAQRFGQTISFLPNGIIVQVAGEHEDSYDEDFCIYNDVFVHNRDGKVLIFGYPKSVFPPTDFHTATLIGEYIYLIGSLGYAGHRAYGTTPVYRLHTESFQIEPAETRGVAPGWLYKHRAVRLGSDEIQISGGNVVTHDGVGEVHAANLQTFVFDTSLSFWRIV